MNFYLSYFAKIYKSKYKNFKRLNWRQETVTDFLCVSGAWIETWHFLSSICPTFFKKYFSLSAYIDDYIKGGRTDWYNWRENGIRGERLRLQTIVNMQSEKKEFLSPLYWIHSTSSGVRVN